MQQGIFSMQQTCPTCHGSGKEIPDPCVVCHGEGKVKKTKTLQVKIPAGIDDGMRIRSSGNGEPGVNGGPAGDLYVEIRIKPHGIFQRDGEDLHCELTIPFTTAALGGTVEVPTLTGRGEITIPEGTQVGKTFRLRGKGVRTVRDARTGDLFASGTVSGPEREQRGSFLELSWGGKEPFTAGGRERTFLEDGDTVTLRATAPGAAGGRISLGEVTGTVLPATP